MLLDVRIGPSQLILRRGLSNLAVCSQRWLGTTNTEPLRKCAFQTPCLSRFSLGVLIVETPCSFRYSLGLLSETPCLYLSVQTPCSFRYSFNPALNIIRTCCRDNAVVSGKVKGKGGRVQP